MTSLMEQREHDRPARRIQVSSSIISKETRNEDRETWVSLPALIPLTCGTSDRSLEPRSMCVLSHWLVTEDLR